MLVMSTSCLLLAPEGRTVAHKPVGLLIHTLLIVYETARNNWGLLGGTMLRFCGDC